MRRFIFRHTKLLLAATLLLMICAAGLLRGASVPSHTVTFYAMDTLMQMTAYGSHAKQGLQQAQTRICDIGRMCSAYQPDGEIYQLNNGMRTTVTAELFSLLQRTLALCEQTGGRFDITIKPFADLWGINGEAPRVPTQAELNTAREAVGWQDVRLNTADHSVTFLKKGMGLDLGGVAKGYATDEALRILRENGVESAYLDLGGNVAVLGEKPMSARERLPALLTGRKTRPYKVGIQAPNQPRGTVARVVEAPSGQCVVTSGDYERYFEADGIRYHHILDPATGQPARPNGVHSVTILSDSGLLADALSTAIFVEPELAKQFPEIEVIFLP